MTTELPLPRSNRHSIASGDVVLCNLPPYSTQPWLSMGIVVHYALLAEAGIRARVVRPLDAPFSVPRAAAHASLVTFTFDPSVSERMAAMEAAYRAEPGFFDALVDELLVGPEEVIRALALPQQRGRLSVGCAPGEGAPAVVLRGARRPRGRRGARGAALAMDRRGRRRGRRGRHGRAYASAARSQTRRVRIAPQRLSQSVPGRTGERSTRARVPRAPAVSRDRLRTAHAALCRRQPADRPDASQLGLPAQLWVLFEPHHLQPVHRRKR